MGSPLKIVKMTHKDLPQVLAIEHVSFPLPFSENLFHMELDLNIAHMMVAKSGNDVKGYLDFWHINGEMHVISIAIHPNARKQGIGTQLMNYAIEYGKNNRAKQIYLDVRESNSAAIKLYEKFGFEKIDIRKGYYQDNEEDALVMCLKLSHVRGER